MGSPGSRACAVWATSCCRIEHALAAHGTPVLEAAAGAVAEHEPVHPGHDGVFPPSPAPASSPSRRAAWLAAECTSGHAGHGATAAATAAAQVRTGPDPGAAAGVGCCGQPAHQHVAGVVPLAAPAPF